MSGSRLLFGSALSGLLGCHAAPVDSTEEPIAPYDPLPWVEPRIGTGGLGAGIGALNPGAGRPFGMVVAGPEGRGEEGATWWFYHFGGYHYDDTHLSGFAHTHAQGMGVADFSTLSFMPRARWSPEHTTGPGRMAPFTHDREWASPGWYEVDLQDDGTHVQIAATDRGALHRWTFAAHAEPAVILDLDHHWGTDTGTVDSWIDIDVEAGRITGYQRYSGQYSNRFGGLRNWFVAELDPKPEAAGTWAHDGEPEPGITTRDTPGGGAWVTFPEGTAEVRMRIALSYVDLDGAEANLRAELPDFDIERVRAQAEAAWRDELGNVRVRGGTDEERTIFHTALYHAYQWPNRIDDVDGRYRGIDDAVHEDASFAHYTNFSLWDTFRTTHPWLILARPDRQRDMARSLVQMYRDGGSMPRWPMAHGYTGGMVGAPAAQVLTETWLKGIDGWDVDTAFEACWAHATGPMPNAGRGGIETYLDRGYLTAESQGGAASKTLEYAWNDWALSNLATSLGKPIEAQQLLAQAQRWPGTWDPETEFFWSRREDGSFDNTDDPRYWSESFTEGGAWQYVWGVPWDVPGMIEVQHGGDRDAFLERLAGLWRESYDAEETVLFDLFYWHGNEPDLHYAFLGALAGDLDASARPIRWVLADKYRATADGLDGNDDGGTLSAWYLFAAIGLYPLAGSDTYALGSPLFERTELDLPGGDSLVIRAPDADVAHPFVGAVYLDGEPWWHTTIDHRSLLEGGELVLEMSTLPGGWGDR